MLKKYLLFLILGLIFNWTANSQIKELANPVFMGSSQALETKPLSEKNLESPIMEFKIVNPRNRGSNKVVPGKGNPKTIDAVWQKKPGDIPGKEPILSFDAASSHSTPTDPTGAVGPNHYLNAWNYSFAIYDKQGEILLPPAPLSSLGGTFEGEEDGDPIVIYDEFADRFLITQFSISTDSLVPSSFLVAVSKGPDPVNDGWYTYRFHTGEAFPDYPKLSVWSDGYYLTTNKSSGTAGSSEVIYVLERDKMLQGLEAQHIGFPLPGISTNGFYSPAGFFAVGKELPPKGNSPILYFQDDSWLGVNEDHLKIWLVNVDWENPGNSTIKESQELGTSEGVTPFISTFDGGSFTNLSQAGNYPEVDALQGAVMYMSMYRRFATHNSVVLNFVVDVNASAAEHAGIRWYELRQDSGGGPWRVYQEGTYAPDDSDRWCGSIGIDAYGNIGMGYTVMNDNPENPIFPSLRYTGRYAGNELGKMTFREASIVEGPSPNPSNRYGDYAHVTIDPLDNETFWYIGEYFVNQDRLNRIGVFKLEPELTNDVGIVDIVAPQDATLGSEEEVSVTIWNFGLDSQTEIPIQFFVNGKLIASEVFNGTLPRTSEENFTFSTKVDLSNVGEEYEITARTNLEGDENIDNDEYSENIENLLPNDVGISSIDAPVTGMYMNNIEEVSVTLTNFGGEPQSNFPLSYSINNQPPVSETYTEILEVGESTTYTFNTGADISEPGVYTFYATTALPEDSDPENDDTIQVIANLSCIPKGSDCGFGDGISDFYLGDIINENIPCNTGYADFIGFSTELDRSEDTHTLSVQTRFASGEDEKFSVWIDFNDNGTFEDPELLLSEEVVPTANTKHSYEFEIPFDAPLGEHILRIRAGDTSYGGNLNNPCSVMEYGTTHDYSVVIVDSTLEIEDLVLTEAELIIYTSGVGDDVFNISMQTSYEDPLRITVHDLQGQKLVENIIEKNGRVYQYQLNMSYAASGVYLIRLGTREVGKVKRIIVP